MTIFEITVLIISGIFVGFINTLAGGGTAISLAVLVMLGLPVNIANGTHRIAAVFQTLTSAATFNKQRVLDVKKGFLLGIPVIIGSVIGARIAVDVNEAFFKKAVAISILIMLIFMIVKPAAWIYGKPQADFSKVSLKQIIFFFIIGIYGGFIHIGVGYFLLAGIVMVASYDLLKANAIKVFIVLLYLPFALIVFILNDQVNYMFGLVHAIGNVIGAFIGARLAIKGGSKTVRWIMVFITIFIVLYFFDVINLSQLI
ncbi:sulfite exporter TauE/SafE family protein [Bacteroidota bacterium]